MKPSVVELRSVRRHTLSVLPVVTLEAQATAGAVGHTAADTNGTPRLTGITMHDKLQALDLLGRRLGLGVGTTARGRLPLHLW